MFCSCFVFIPSRWRRNGLTRTRLKASARAARARLIGSKRETETFPCLRHCAEPPVSWPSVHSAMPVAEYMHAAGATPRYTGHDRHLGTPHRRRRRSGTAATGAWRGCWQNSPSASSMEGVRGSVPSHKGRKAEHPAAPLPGCLNQAIPSQRTCLSNLPGRPTLLHAYCLSSGPHSAQSQWQAATFGCPRFAAPRRHAHRYAGLALPRALPRVWLA